MTIAELAAILLRYNGVTSFDPANNADSLNQQGVAAGDIAAVVACINGGLEEIYQNGPSTLVTKSVGDVLRPPTNITFSASQYSIYLNSLLGYSDWMNGCTIRVSGDSDDNRLLAGSSTSLSVVGTTNPDCTGTYVQQGSVNGQPFYVHFDVAGVASYGLFYLSGVWYIEALAGCPVVKTNHWETSSGVSGGYDPHGSYTGSPFVIQLSGATLKRPYMGATGSVTATVYADCIALASYYAAIIEPVRIPARAPMRMIGSHDEFERCYTSPINSNDPTYRSITTNKTIAEPQRWFCESEYNSGDTATLAHLRLDPMPGTAYPIEYKVKLRAPVITADDIYTGTAYTTDPNRILPLDLVSSVLLPICLQRWTANPSFSADNSRTEISRQYQVAMTELKRERRMIGRTPAIYAE